MKRIERKQLKEDQLASGLTRFLGFIKKWTRELVIAGGVLAFLLVIFAVSQLVKAHNLAKENKVITQILSLREEADKRPESLARLEALAGSGKFSRLAYIELATYWFDRGDLAKAKADLEKIGDTPKDMLYYQAQDLLGRVYLGQKSYDKAVEIFKKIEKDNPKSFPLDAILFHQAEALEQKGDRAAALALYKKIQEQFPQTYYGYDATQRLSKLETGK
jgi:predicted negative regulator of RcsB-dependent stress response